MNGPTLDQARSVLLAHATSRLTEATFAACIRAVLVALDARAPKPSRERTIAAPPRFAPGTTEALLADLGTLLDQVDYLNEPRACSSTEMVGAVLPPRSDHQMPRAHQPRPVGEGAVMKSRKPCSTLAPTKGSQQRPTTAGR